MLVRWSIRKGKSWPMRQRCGRQTARVKCCSALGLALAKVGQVMWVGGYIVGPIGPPVRDRASNERKDGETLFLRCSIWRPAAEHASESLTRGMRGQRPGPAEPAQLRDQRGREAYRRRTRCRGGRSVAVRRHREDKLQPAGHRRCAGGRSVGAGAGRRSDRRTLGVADQVGRRRRSGDGTVPLLRPTVGATRRGAQSSRGRSRAWR